MAEDFDVIVVGGGSAGVSSAIAASNLGARVCLIEKYGFLGGQAVSANVGTICGLVSGNLDKNLSQNQEKEKLKYAGLFANEFIRGINSISKKDFITHKEKISFLPYDAWAFEKNCLNLLKQADVKVFLHSTCIEAVVLKNKAEIESVFIYSMGEKIKLSGRAFIDASGEAVLSKLSQISYIKEEIYQAPAIVFKISNLDSTTLSEHGLSIELMDLLLRAEKKGEFVLNKSRLSVVPGSLKNQECLFKLSVPFCREDSFESLTAIELYARNLVSDIFIYLKNERKEFSNCNFSFASSQSGIRTGPRGLGRYVLAEQDVLSGRKFENFITNGLWPIETWGDSGKPNMTYLDQGYYQIPAESLVSDYFSNLYFVGRGISADSKAISSARVIGTAFGTGYAAGFIGSLVIRGKKLTEAISMLQLSQYPDS